MSTVGLWLVIGGALLATLCVGVSATALLRLVRGAARPRREPIASGRGPVPASGTDGQQVWRHLLEAAVEEAGADAGALSVAVPGSGRLRHSVSLSAGEAASLLGALEAAPPARASTVRYRFPDRGTIELEGVVRQALLVPLHAGGRPVGAIGVYWRGEAGGRPVERLPALEKLAAIASAPWAPNGGPVVPAVRREPAQSAAEVRRLEALASLAATLELPELARKLLAAVVDGQGADAAAIGLHPPAEEGILVDSLHLTADEAAWLAASLEADTHLATITRYVDEAAGAEPPAETPIGTAVVVPLRDRDGDQVGNLAALWRRDIEGAADAQLAQLERFVEDVREALDNALRFAELQALAVRDPHTGLLDRRYFFGKLGEEVARARRANTSLVLLLLELEAAKPPAAPLGPAELDELVAEGAARLRASIGASGIACRVAAGEFAVILPPGTTLAAGSALLDRVLHALLPPGEEEPEPRYSGTAVELVADEDAAALFDRARRAIGELRTRG